MSETRTTAWGARAEDWSLFADQLSLREDLLPVVSNPNATISGRSNMQQLGKTPSLYNRDGEVVGIPKWTDHKATDRDIKRWMAQPDLGICAQTRTVRAIDIDIEDGVQAQYVRDVVEMMGHTLPLRWRAGSGKCLLAFRMPGSFVKRIIRTAHGAIEFLATGQQFIAVGTHPKGQRYEWEGLPCVDGFPELTPAQFEHLWAVLQEEFGIEPEITGKVGMRPPQARDAGASNDDKVIAYLEAKGLVRSWERDGRVNLHCPWSDEHTTDSGETATQWFPAGVGGFDQGHFKCLHAHCAARGRDEFLDQVGFTRDEFEDVAPETVTVTTAAGTEVAVVKPEDRPKPVYQRKRSGAIVGSLPNVELALARPDVCLRHIAYDEFRAEIVMADWSLAGEADEHALQWRAFSDADYGRLKVHLERGCGFENVAIEHLRMGVLMHAMTHKMDSAIEWLTHRVPAWDGVPRIDSFMPTYLGAVDSPYVRAVGAYMLTAMAGRVLEPGCQADMVPVLISGEGTGKTTSVKLLLPDARAHYVEINLQERDDNLARSMRGKLLGEIAELRGLSTRDEESIKAWVTRTHEEWTPKYREFGVQFPRRLLCIGTSNAEEGFLANDGAAARRWLPVRVGDTDKAALVRDRDQLWAEARTRWLANGVEWQAAHQLGRDARDEHRVVDDWQLVVEQWLLMGEMDDPQGPARGWSPVTTADVLTSAIGLPVRQITRRDQERAAKVLKALGYVRKKTRVAGRGTTVWAFCPTEACNFLRQVQTSTLDLA